MAEKKKLTDEEKREKETQEVRELFEQRKFDEEVFGRHRYGVKRPQVRVNMGMIPAGAEDEIEFLNFRREFERAIEQSIRDNQERLAKQGKEFKAPYPEFPKK
jgi:hypothetical protein